MKVNSSFIQKLAYNPSGSILYIQLKNDKNVNGFCIYIYYNVLRGYILRITDYESLGRWFKVIKGAHRNSDKMSDEDAFKFDMDVGYFA